MQTCNGIKKDLAPVKDSSAEVDIFPWMTAAALELIGEAGLGYSFNSFTRQRNEYKLAIRDVTFVLSIISWISATKKLSLRRFFAKSVPFMKVLPFFYNLGTPGFRRWVLTHNPIRTIRLLLNAVNLQNEQAEEVLRSRQELIASGVDLSSEAGRGRDIMTLLSK